MLLYENGRSFVFGEVNFVVRKHRPESPFKPFWVGIACGYTAAIVIAAAAALILSFTDAAEKGSTAAAIPAICIGSFVCGRTAGFLRKRSGLKTGALCGILFMVPLVILSLIFQMSVSGMLFLKILLCLFFGTVGGVAGVNSNS